MVQVQVNSDAICCPKVVWKQDYIINGNKYFSYLGTFLGSQFNFCSKGT